MNRTVLASICTWVSLVCILVGFGSIFAALQSERTANWGQIISGCTPQAILIAGGVVALAIVASAISPDNGKN